MNIISRRVIKEFKVFYKKLCSLIKKIAYDSSNHQTTEEDNRQFTNNSVTALSQKIDEKELINKVLYYLSIPVSESIRFENFNSFIIQMNKQKHMEGEKIIKINMKKKYSNIINELIKNLLQGNRSISLNITKLIETNLKEDKKKFL